jgi:signal peptidase I
VWPLLAQHGPGGGAGGFQQTIDALARTPLSQIVIFVAICTIVRIALYKYLRGTLPHQRHGIYPVAKFVNEAMDAVVYAGVFVFMLIRPFAVQAFLIPSGSMEQTLYVNDFIVANKAIYRYSEPEFKDIVVFKPPAHALNKNQSDVDFIKRCIGTPGHVIEIKQGKLWRDGSPVDEPYMSDSPGDGPEANGHPMASGKDVKMNTDWKLVYYQGKARPALAGTYIPVQINRNVEAPHANCNFGPGVGIARIFAVGPSPDSDENQSAVTSWKSEDELLPQEWEFERELQAAKPAAIPKGYLLMMGDNRNNSYDGRCWGLVPRDDIIGRSEFIWLPINRWRITR